MFHAYTRFVRRGPLCGDDPLTVLGVENTRSCCLQLGQAVVQTLQVAQSLVVSIDTQGDDPLVVTAVAAVDLDVPDG